MPVSGACLYCQGRAGPGVKLEAVPKAMYPCWLQPLLAAACIALRKVKERQQREGGLERLKVHHVLMISPAVASQKGLPASVAQMTELVWVSAY